MYFKRPSTDLFIHLFFYPIKYILLCLFNHYSEPYNEFYGYFVDSIAGYLRMRVTAIYPSILTALLDLRPLIISTGFPYSKLVSRTLYLQVLDYDRFSRDDPIGEIQLPLSELDLSKNQTFSKSLMPCKSHVVSREFFGFKICLYGLRLTFRLCFVFHIMDLLCFSFYF